MSQNDINDKYNKFSKIDVGEKNYIKEKNAISFDFGTKDKENKIKFYSTVKDNNPYFNLSDQEVRTLINQTLSKRGAIDNTSLQTTNTSGFSSINTTPQTSQPKIVPVSPVTPSAPIVNSVIQGFLNDMLIVPDRRNFRGWILPDGQMISQYNVGVEREDHGNLVHLFMDGLYEFDRELADRMMLYYTNYRAENYNAFDPHESFAVDALGWIQVSEFGLRRIISRGENWQDKLIAPFIIDYGFDLVSSNNPNQGRCYNSIFIDIYEHTQEILELALNKRYEPLMAAAGRR